MAIIKCFQGQFSHIKQPRHALKSLPLKETEEKSHQEGPWQEWLLPGTDSHVSLTFSGSADPRVPGRKASRLRTRSTGHFWVEITPNFSFLINCISCS